MPPRHDAQMIGLRMAGRGSGHVAHDEIGRPAEQRAQALGRVRVEEIELQDLGSFDRLHGREIDGDDMAPALAGLAALDGDLGPAAGGGAEIDDARARLDKTEAEVEWGEL